MNATRIAPILALALVLTAGCEPSGGNRSPTPDQDPDRYARALVDDRNAAAENREAEARFLRAARVALPGEGPMPASLTANGPTP